MNIFRTVVNSKSGQNMLQDGIDKRDAQNVAARKFLKSDGDDESDSDMDLSETQSGVQPKREDPSGSASPSNGSTAVIEPPWNDGPNFGPQPMMSPVTANLATVRGIRNITVKRLGDQAMNPPIIIPIAETVDDIKAILTLVTQVPLEKIRLVKGAQQLESGRSLAEYESLILPNTQIYMIRILDEPGLPRPGVLQLTGGGTRTKAVKKLNRVRLNGRWATC